LTSSQKVGLSKIEFRVTIFSKTEEKCKIVTMKKSKFTESQIAFAIKQAETGTKVEEVCR
jgi:hypothetical protein